jgi:hypothetical protein
MSESTLTHTVLFFVVSAGSHPALCSWLCKNTTHCWIAFSASLNKELSKKQEQCPVPSLHRQKMLASTL